MYHIDGDNDDDDDDDNDDDGDDDDDALGGKGRVFRFPSRLNGSLMRILLVVILAIS